MRNGLIEAMPIHPEAEVASGFDRVDLGFSTVVSIDSVVPEAHSRTHSTGLDPSSFLYKVGKRFADVCICCLLLPILLPFFVVIMLAVRLSSPGPLFYREKRIGQFGKPFIIFKFRSMYTKEHLRDVLHYKECETTQMKRRLDQKHHHDPRITPVGKYLRKLSLDELPQLINVVRGDMSLIGPRPVVEAELERYGSYAHFYKLMLPGITGLWQVSGRNDVSYVRRVLMDAEYCINWSPWYDVSILLRTIPVVLKTKGAY